ncbi:MAG TPA: serine hydrolase [Bryobacteraceae bacterium]
MTKLLCGLLVAATTIPCAAGQPLRAVRVALDSEIRSILGERIDRFKQSVGIVVGVVEPQGQRVVSYGLADKRAGVPVSRDSVFEIGSITKVFTSLLLSNMCGRGEVALEDPVAKYLPANVRVPERGGRLITLQDLASHTSGLPREATNLRSRDPAKPYDNYSTDDLYAFLSSYKLTRDIGAKYEYSNVGAALLGVALARRIGTDYKTLVRTRILEPLGMMDSGFGLPADDSRRMAKGYRFSPSGIEPTPNWTMGAYEAAGAMRSTANDILNFLSGALGYAPNPLSKDMAAMLEVLRPAGVDGFGDRRQVGLGWHVLSLRSCFFVCASEETRLVIQDGRTSGYDSFAGYDPDARIGVVVLSNAGYGAGVADIGLHLLNSKLPLLSGKALDLPMVHTEIAVDPAVLESYVGRYEFPDDKEIWSIRREGARLFASHPAAPENEIFPETSSAFFLKIADAQMTFVIDKDRRVTCSSHYLI